METNTLPPRTSTVDGRGEVSSPDANPFSYPINRSPPVPAANPTTSAQAPPPDASHVGNVHVAHPFNRAPAIEKAPHLYAAPDMIPCSSLPHCSSQPLPLVVPRAIKEEYVYTDEEEYMYNSYEEEVEEEEEYIDLSAEDSDMWLSSDEESLTDSSLDEAPGPPRKKSRRPMREDGTLGRDPAWPKPSKSQGSSRDRHGWTTDITTIPIQSFEGRKPYGPTIERPVEDNALGYFTSFFPLSLFSKVARYTNLFGQSSLLLKKNTTPAEIRAWVGIRMIQGVHSNTNCDDDWSTHPALRNSLVASTMTRARFHAISEALTCTNPTKEPKSKGKKEHNPLHRLKTIWDTVTEACRVNYNPRKELSLDEVTIKSKVHRSVITQAPTKMGSNIYAVCEAQSGYILHMMLHSESGHRKHGIPFQMMQPFLGCYHQLFCGNRYTSTALAKDLLVNQTYLCGAVGLSSKGLPVDFTSQGDDDRGRHRLIKKMLNSPRGTTYTWQQGQMTMVIWRGNKVMPILSTGHQGYRDQTNHFLSRNVREKGEQTCSKKMIPAPSQAIDYSKFKGGVEHANQLRSYHSCNRQHSKAWKKILYFLMDMARVNAWICYKAFTDGGTGTQVSHRMFTVNIAMSLIAGFAEGTPAYQATMPPVPAINGPNHACIRMKVKNAKMCMQCRRMGRKTGKGNPITTRTGCIGCNIHLCRGRCFLEFHSAVE